MYVVVGSLPPPDHRFGLLGLQTNPPSLKFLPLSPFFDLLCCSVMVVVVKGNMMVSFAYITRKERMNYVVKEKGGVTRIRAEGE